MAGGVGPDEKGGLGMINPKGIGPRLLILGGTADARALVAALAPVCATGDAEVIISLAGRVASPVLYEGRGIAMRVGGFGGVAGLVAYMKAHEITHLIDATHPFAAQMSTHAVAAAHEARLPLVALERPPWRAQPGDLWQNVPDLQAAAAALGYEMQRRVLLAVGRMHLSIFAKHPLHFYLLRLVDSPAAELPFPHHHVIVARGPFKAAEDQALMAKHRIDVVVSKNAGGSGAYAKIVAARALQRPVIMVGRPYVPPRKAVVDVAGVLDWLQGFHPELNLGV